MHWSQSKDWIEYFVVSRFRPELHDAGFGSLRTGSVNPKRLSLRFPCNYTTSDRLLTGFALFVTRRRIAMRCAWASLYFSSLDPKRGFGVKITSDSSVYTRRMRSEVLRIGFHFTSRAEWLSLRFRQPKYFGLPRRRVTETHIRSEKQSVVNPIRRRVTRALFKLL